MFTPKEYMDELSYVYGFSQSAKEVEYLLDLPEGTLSVSNIIDFKSLKLKSSRK